MALTITPGNISNGPPMENPSKKALQDPKAVLESLRGQKIVLHDLNKTLGEWPKEVNPHLAKLRQDVNAWLESTMGHSHLLMALKAADFGFFGATWWPRAKYERLRILTFLATWLFTWDDELDMDDGSLWDDMERSQVYRAEIFEYTRFCLGLSSKRNWQGVEPSLKVIRNFEVIGIAIRDAYSIEQRERFSREMQIYLDMTEQEQRLRMRGTLPSIEEFFEYRQGSSAVNVVLAANEFALGDMQLPYSTLEHPKMRLLWSHTNMIISMVNDLLSLKKEVIPRLTLSCENFKKQSSILSLVPLLQSQYGDAQAAVDQASKIIADHVAMFDEVALQLLLGDLDGSPQQLQNYIRSCRFLCSGNLTWSLKTQRYGIDCEEMSHGVEVTL